MNGKGPRWFCEACGRRQTWMEHLRGRSLAWSEDLAMFVCPDCRAQTGHAAAARRLAGPLFGARRSPMGIVASVAAIGGLLLVIALQPKGMGPPTEGAVQGALEAPPSPFGSQAATDAPIVLRTDAAATASAEPSSTRPTRSDTPTGVADASPGKPVVLTWTGPFGELRLQIILSVQNVGADWLRLPRSKSSYRILDEGNRELAGGVFTAALPEFVGPGETAYLVDTLSTTFADPRQVTVAEADVHAVAADPPSTLLSVAAVAVSTGPGGGLEASGQVRNDGAVPARSVMAGVVALDHAGRPIGAVYDLTDVGQIEPGSTIPFATEYPGAPPIRDSAVGSILGFAFETDD